MDEERAAILVADHARKVGRDATTPFLLPVMDNIPVHTHSDLSVPECKACRWVMSVARQALNILDGETV